jgi:hypothetical protein
VLWRRVCCVGLHPTPRTRITTTPPLAPAQDPGVARAALVTCRDLLPPYAACVDKHLTAKQRELVAVPQYYKEQTLAAEVAAQPPGGARK